jgi:hypothetical protein
MVAENLASVQRAPVHSTGRSLPDSSIFFCLPFVCIGVQIMKSLHPKFFPRFTGQQAKTLSGFYSMECHRNGTFWFTPQAGSSFRVNVRTDRVYPFQKL